VTASAEAITLDRTFSFANEAMFTVVLQLRRVASDEPEDKEFVFRRWADWQFLIVALRRLQRAAELGATTPTGAKVITAALVQFRSQIPGLTTMRNVAEHIDSYAVDDPKRHHKSVDRWQLQVGQLSSDEYVWLGHTLNAAHVKATAEALFVAVRTAYRSLPPARVPA
jgi:hypothetical protein